MKRTVIFLLTLLFAHFALMSQTPDGSNIAYGPEESEKLDYWEASQDNSPIVLIIPGKDWASGNKDMAPWKDAVPLFHENGYAVVIMDYVLSSDPAYKGYPQQPANLACAIGWTKENASQLKGDPEQLILFGASAGAHLAALHALRPFSSETAACDYSTDMDVLGVIALSGIYDFDVIPKGTNSRKAVLKMVHDSTAYWKDAQPIEAQLSGNPETCFLLLHGTRDAFAGNGQPLAFDKFLTDNNFCVETDILENRQADLINDLADPESWVAERIIAFANDLSQQPGETPTAVLPAGNPSSLKVYPNPTEEDLLIVLEPGAYRLAEFILTGMDGREILHTTKRYEEKIRLDVRDYPQGTYILSILTDRDQHHHKVIIH